MSYRRLSILKKEESYKNECQIPCIFKAGFIYLGNLNTFFVGFTIYIYYKPANPGSTTTKYALFYLNKNRIDKIIEETIEHSDKEISRFPNIYHQIEYREKPLLYFIKENLPKKTRVVACVGRGGMLTPSSQWCY